PLDVELVLLGQLFVVLVIVLVGLGGVVGCFVVRRGVVGLGRTHGRVASRVGALRRRRTGARPGADPEARSVETRPSGWEGGTWQRHSGAWATTSSGC